MGILGRKRGFTFTLIISAAFLFPLTAHAAGLGSLSDRVPATRRENDVELTQDMGTYEVRRGDCLWSIAERMWGDGSLCGELFAHNRGRISDPDLIWEGMLLDLKRTVYVRGQSPQRNNSMWGYTFPAPEGSTVGIREFGDNGSNFCMSGDGVIACLVRDKERAAVETVSDWRTCTERLEKYAREHYDGRVSDFTFEHYETAEGEDIYLYSCRCKVDLAKYGYDDSVEASMCAGMKLTENLQAEFVGFDFDDGITDTVRGVTVGFAELPREGRFTSVNGSNMAIWPDNEWEMEGMYNAVAWVTDSLEYMADRAVNRSEGREETMRSKYHK